METIDLNLVRAFVAVHDEGGFSAAAGKLGVPRSTVSRAVAALEGALGVRLFHRTTRKVSVSAAGADLYQRALPSLSALEDALRDLPEREEAPSGTLRVTAAPDLGTLLLADAVARYIARYPKVRVELKLTSQIVDLVQEGIDVAIRASGKALHDSSLVARKLGAVSFELYASPAYLARRGVPRGRDDLGGHDLVSFAGSPGLFGPGHQPRVVCDDLNFLREALRAGAGLGALPVFLAENDVLAGTLTRVLPSWEQGGGTLYLVQPSRKQPPAKVSAFRDLLVELLRQRPLARRTP